MCKETLLNLSNLYETILTTIFAKVIDGITQYDYRQMIRALAVMETVIDMNN